MNSKNGLTTHLWNKNFTILVIGSFISMMGYTCASFAMSLLVYDESQQVLFFALTQVAAMLPRIIMPMLAGTYFDRHSRARSIFKLDYGYTIVFAIVTVLLYFKSFPYWLFIFVSLIIGSIDGAYMVAFDSVFPLLTTTQTTRKAYSINSMLYPIASIITAPLTLFFYDKIGPLAIFAGSTLLFAITATVETLIKVREPHLVRFEPEKQAKLPPSPKELELSELGIDIVAQQEVKERTHFFTDFKEGVKYILAEKGLMAITMYFFVLSITGALMGTLMIPYFRSTTGWALGGWQMEGMYAYMIVFGASTIGRLVGANVQYRVKFKKEKRFNVAVAVYMITSLIYIIVFHLPLWLMIIFMLIEGMLSVTSYNIRISSTQVYVPDNKRGRFNGAFLFFNMLGSIVGQLIAGFIGDLNWSVPIIVSVAFIFNFAAVFFIVFPAKKSISTIYNADL
ncbi:MAG TPA: MFS transporter [Eubacteriales bacterium]|mgnify:CR=1 FL=1|nr:MFS transporter [Eubacteriales bacterium]